MRSISQLLRLPLICILCNQFHKGQYPVCTECMELFIPLTSCCPYCAYPSQRTPSIFPSDEGMLERSSSTMFAQGRGNLADKEFSVCGLCIKNTPQFDQAFIGYIFEEPLRTLLHQFKYQQAFYLTAFFTHLMLLAIKKEGLSPSIQCLMPIPMHAKRLKQRGFNQAALLAKTLAKKTQIPCDLSSCKKIIHTLPQASLKSEARKKNLLGSFSLHKMPPYKHVVLVDDLLTTGNTANELAKTLKIAGVEKVDIWCCARAVK